MSKQVIDAGALRSAALEKFLRASRTNTAVITDYASMESFKGDGAVNIRRSLEIISRFPQQVLILKSTAEVCALRPRSSGLHGRLLDRRQTAGFPKYCCALFNGVVHPADMAYDIASKSAASREQFARMERTAAGISTAWTALFKSYTRDELQALRRQGIISARLANRIIRDVFVVTARFFRDMNSSSDMPSTIDALYSFPFRFALCTYVLALHWAVKGGYQSASTHTIRNDFTDATYASYATFYDGIITLDQKLNEIYMLSRWMLNALFFGRLPVASA